MNKLDDFFNPNSVAIIGASRFPGKPGHVIFRNFIEGGFKGHVWPINPKTKELFGKKCYASVLDVKTKIDLAIIIIPSPVVPKILKECGKKKIPAAIIISGGFKEIGRSDLENQVLSIARKYKMRILGTNCIGIYDPYSGIDTIFNPKYKLERPKRGQIAFITQSGAIGTIILDWMAMKGYKISKFVSYGNATDINETDLISYLAKDSRTSVICAFIEGVKDGRQFYTQARQLSKKKPIIILKGGVTSEGTKAVSSHTGSLAGQARIYSAAFKQAGVIEASDMEQIFDFARVFSTQPESKGPRIQVITDGGGLGVLLTDWIIKTGLQLAKMSSGSLKKLKRAFPPHFVISNPIDLTGDATTEDYAVALKVAMADPGIDMIAAITLFQVPKLTPDITDIIVEAARKRQKPLIVIAAGGRYTEVLKKSLEDTGVPCFSYPERAARAMRALYEYTKYKKG